jgi:vacuolar-type H+-ATPase subunit E/Vma4
MNSTSASSALKSVALVSALFAWSSVAWSVTDLEAMIAQTASTLASVDYATVKCDSVKIDEKALDDLVKRTGKSLAELRKDEDYADQKDAIAGVEKSKGVKTVCAVLPSSHGGYGRGIITAK